MSWDDFGDWSIGMGWGVCEVGGFYNLGMIRAVSDNADVSFTLGEYR